MQVFVDRCGIVVTFNVGETMEGDGVDGIREGHDGGRSGLGGGIHARSSTSSSWRSYLPHTVPKEGVIPTALEFAQ